MNDINEDIRILEEMKQNCLTKREYIDPKAERKAQAIKNLIKGYRKLEAKVKRYEKYLDNKDKRFKEALENEYQERETDYISKSKIKEKIEEWDKSIKWNSADDRYYAIKILQELMGDRKNG